jgi:hypothetical protein
MSLMHTTTALLLIAVAAAAAVGCSSSRTSEGPNIGPSKRLAELSEEEVRTWCTWSHEWHLERYEPNSLSEPLCPDGTGSLGTVDDCVGTFERIDPDCSQTVGRQTRCLVDELAGECPALFPIHEGSPCRWPDDCGIPYPDD